MTGLACPKSRLEPIVNVWDELDCQIKGCSSHPKLVKKLACLLQAEWKQNTTVPHPNTCGKQARRVKTVIASGEGSTYY
ncbi:hypothetical protein TNCV_415941 [Trichonephila clavipes]|nr:hypothetical protein TNCV_415941 [Trichonephila clavipes]